MADVLIPTLDHLKQAYAVTSTATQMTPLLESAALARETGAARVFVKPESLQWAGSFKVRGAYWRLTRLSPDDAKKGVVAYSSGNFAQGLAAAGQALGIPVTIVMPIDAPAAKRDATAGYGARVVLTDHGERAREEVAAAKAREIADRHKVAFKYYDVIYELTDEIRAGMAGQLGPEAFETVVGRAEIREVFSAGKHGRAAGLLVVEGFIRKALKARITRDDVIIYNGSIASLRRFKDDVAEVRAGLECGVTFESHTDIKPGDFLETFEVELRERTL